MQSWTTTPTKKYCHAMGLDSRLENTTLEDPRSAIEITIQSAFLLFVILVSLLGNTLILVAIYRNYSLRSITNVFIANLAVADFLLALFGMPFTMTSSITFHWIFGSIWCTLNGMINSIFCIASMLSLAAVSVDRYIAIIKPLNYPLLMNHRVALLMVSYVWLHAITCALLPAFGWSSYIFIRNESICTADWGSNISYTLFIFASSFFSPLAVMAFCYYHILRVARTQSKKIVPRVGELREEPLQTMVAVPVVYAKENAGAAPTAHATKDKPPPHWQEIEAKKKFNKETRAAKTLLIVMGTFLFCWAPHFIGMTCLLFPSCRWPDEFFATTTWLAMLNSGCNPIIYGVMNKRFRRSFRDILTCARKRQRTIRSYSQRERSSTT